MNNVYLIGLMGAGKTTVGRKIANLTGFQFVDIDQEIVARTGVTIAHIFEVEGEQGFRDRENRVLDEISQGDRKIVSTGGGVIVRDDNVTIMRETGEIVYLDVPFEVLWHRLKGCQNRPLLKVAEPGKRLKKLMIERDPLYKKAATIHLQVSSGSSAKTAHNIVAKLKSSGILQ